MNEVNPGEVIARFGTWAVTSYGLECLSRHYPIPARRVHEGANGGYGWERQMRGKAAWMKYEEFIAALNYAREAHPRMVSAS